MTDTPNETPKDTISYVEGVGRIEDAFLEIFKIPPSDHRNIKVRRLAEVAYSVIVGDIGTGYEVREPDYIRITDILSCIEEINSYAKGSWRVDPAWMTNGVANLYSKNLIHCISERPGYCDRGRYKVLVDVRHDTAPHDTEKVTIQGLSHYYFSKKIAVQESEAWAFASGQFEYDSMIADEDRTLEPITMSHQEEIERLFEGNSELAAKWEVSPDNPVLGAKFKFGDHYVVPFTHPDSRFVWRWLWGVDVTEEYTPNFCIDDVDWFPRAFMSLENALSEVQAFNSFRKCELSAPVAVS